MFSKARNSARISLCLKPDGPFLIKHDAGLDPGRPDMEFVRMRTPYGDVPYVPGSSVKGVVRSTSEALLRSLPLRGPAICDPLDLRESACGSSANRRARGLQTRDKLRYDQHCEACRLFGSTEMAGRARFGDLLPWQAEDDDEERVRRLDQLNACITVRHSVAIERKTGGAKGQALFELEALSGGQFHGEIVLQNYALYQLGLLLVVLGLVDDGTVRLGFGKSRGLGRVRCGVDGIVIDQYGDLGADASALLGADAGQGANPGVSSPKPGQRVPFATRFVLDAGEVAKVRPELEKRVEDLGNGQH